MTIPAIEYRRILARRLQRARKRIPYTQQALADLLKLQREAVSRWEAARSMPRLDQVFPLMSILHVTPEELFATTSRLDDDWE